LIPRVFGSRVRSGRCLPSTSCLKLLVPLSHSLTAARYQNSGTAQYLERAWNTTQYIYGTISVTITTNALVSIVLVFILFGLQMLRRTKPLVVSFQSLGLIDTALASYRLSVFVQIFHMENPPLNESPYKLRTPLSIIKAGLASIAACGPTLKHLLSLIVPMLRSSKTKAGSVTPKWGAAPSIDKSNTRKSRAITKTDSNQGNDVSGSIVELTDTLDWPFGHKSRSYHI